MKMDKKGIIVLSILSLVTLIIVTLVSILYHEPSSKDFSFDELYNLTVVDNEVKCTNYDYVVCLEKNKDKDFKVLNFTDIQLTTSETVKGNNVYEIAKSTIDYCIKEAEPDLITISGDLGYSAIAPLTCIGSIIDSYNIPWAVAFGNHDNQCDYLSIPNQIDLLNTYRNCITKYGPSNIGTCFDGHIRYGTYIINVVEKDGLDVSIVRSLYMINSGDNEIFDVTGKERINYSSYAKLSDEQIDFFKWGVASANRYSKDSSIVKSTIIQHMPISEYYYAYKAASTLNISNDLDVSLSYTDAYWKDGYKDSFGVCHEGICCPPINDNVFDKLNEVSSLDSILVGHDHTNNFCIKYRGVMFAYSLKTGIGCYYDDGLNGGTVLNISNNTDISLTHIYYNY